MLKFETRSAMAPTTGQRFRAKGLRLLRSVGLVTLRIVGGVVFGSGV